MDELRKLQTVEMQLVTIRQNRDGKLRRVEAVKRQIKSIEDRLETNKKAVRERQMKLDSLQLDIATREESIAKHRQALNKTKTNKEYAAILTAMNTEKADSGKIEGSALQMMEDIQKVKDEGTAIEAEKVKSQQDLVIAEKALATFDADSREKLKALEAERDVHARKIPPDAINAFQRAAQRHDGEAMAAVTKPRAKQEEYMCSGCNMNVPLDLINALRNRDDVVLCKNCARILYAEPASAAAKRS